MSKLNRYVDVQISRETTRISTASFDIPLILVTAAEDDDVTDRVLTFFSADEVGEEFGTTSNAYTMALRLFGQQVKPAQIKVGIRLSTESLVQGLAAIRTDDDTWYALLAETHTTADILILAEYIQSLRKIYFTATSDITVPTSAIDDLGTQLKNLGYDRTVLLYSTDATSYPEAGWVGGQLPAVPGSNTWAYKAITGTLVNNLSGTQITNLESKNVNYYLELGGANVTQTGTTSQGEWIDTMIFVDWLTARIQEAIFFRLVNRKKIPMTRKGAALIESEILSVLAQGVINGGIADDTPYTVESPDPTQLSEIQRGQRILGDFTFRARLAGAVHRVVVRGTVYY